MNRYRLSLCVLLALVACSRPPRLTRGPYVQMPDDGAVTIVWRTDQPAESIVEFGLTPTCTDGVVTNPARVIEHAVALRGLQRGTNYFYRVQGVNAVLRTKRAPGQPFRFAVLGDWGSGSAEMSNVAGQINRRTDLDLLLTTGDNIYPSGQRHLYDPYWFSLYVPTMSRAPVFPTLGNHDNLTEDGQPLFDYFSLPTNGPPGQVERHYSFDYGNAHFIALDSDVVHAHDPGPIEALREWLARDLAATRQLWRIAYFHRPAYTSYGSHSEDRQMQHHIMPILEAGGVKLVLAGHNHFYERTVPIRGIVHVVTGAGGAHLYDVWEPAPYSAALNTTNHSFTVIEIAGPVLNLQQISDQGAVLDTFQMTLPPSP